MRVVYQNGTKMINILKTNNVIPELDIARVNVSMKCVVNAGFTFSNCINLLMFCIKYLIPPIILNILFVSSNKNKNIQ